MMLTEGKGHTGAVIVLIIAANREMESRPQWPITIIGREEMEDIYIKDCVTRKMILLCHLFYVIQVLLKVSIYDDH